MFLVDGTGTCCMIKRFVTIGLICCLCVSLVGIAVADSESLRATNAIDTPEQSITGTTITATHIGVFDHDEQIEATVTGPDETYDIGLFNDSSGGPIKYQTDVTETVAFDSNNLAPGSYYLQVNNTAFDSIAPIVISGYDVVVDTTEDTTTNELTINATVTETALERPPHAVEAVVWNEETQTRTELTLDGEFSSSGEYTKNVSLEEYDGEPYQVYVVATSNEEIHNGENEILGVGEDPDNQAASDNTNGGTSASTGSNDTNGDRNSDTNGETDESDNDDSSVIEPNTSTDDESQIDSEPADGTADDTPISMVVPVIALLLTALGIARVRKT